MHADPFGPRSDAAGDPADRVAREAARRMLSGRSHDERTAIDAAQQELGLPNAWPSVLRVRRHLEAMEQQAAGAEAWAAARDRRLRGLEELMTLLETQGLGDRILLVGRAARGHLTGADPIRMRIYTEHPIGVVADVLELAGVDDPDFETDDTGYGRYDAMRWVDEEAGEILLVRLPPEMWARRTQNLYHRDEAVAIEDLAGLRARLDAAGDAEATDAMNAADQSAAENAAASSSAKEG
jgi:hypothetical protein